MRTLIVFLSLYLACFPAYGRQGGGKGHSSAQAVGDSLIRALINETNLDSLYRTLDLLSGEDSVTINDTTFLIISRNANHPHNDLAADFIYSTLHRYGLTTYNQYYGSTGRNVFAVKAGTVNPDKQIILCAHYDDMPYQPAPGADDNGSGVSAVLEAARLLAHIPTPYTIIFALWDEEEIGPLGSAYYAYHAYLDGDDIVAVVNLEMFGWDFNDDGLFDIHTMPIGGSVQLAQLVRYVANFYSLGLDPIIYNPGETASDHSSFWYYGYSATAFSEAFWGGDFNPYYHTSNDRRVHFNSDFFHALSKLAVATTAHLSFYGISFDAVEDPGDAVPSTFALFQNYPNPFNPTTTIKYSVPSGRDLVPTSRDGQIPISNPQLGFGISGLVFVSLKVFDILGREVAILVDEVQNPGLKKVEFNADNLASGVYLYRLEAGGRVDTKKLVVLK